MVPRKRTRSRAGWPENLYPNRDGFKYRHPITKKETYMGLDRAKAFAAAKKLNALLMDGGDLVSRVKSDGKRVQNAVDVFRVDDMPKRKWRPATAATYEIYLRLIERGIGKRDLETFAVKDCATFIRGATESERGRQDLRLVLIWVLACAVEEGWLDHNPAQMTRKFVHERKRERLTLDAYKAIHAQAPAWVQNAMDVSLLTLLRREDVVAAKFSDVIDDALHVIPIKTADSSGIRIQIPVEGDLANVLARCRDAVVSPFLIHRLPGRARPSDQRAKERTHHTQVMPEQLTRAFAESRDAAGVGGDNPPTFHEIRSLGAALLLQSGWTEKEVQALLTHSSLNMTREYLEGHERPYETVRTGLSLPR